MGFIGLAMKRLPFLLCALGSLLTVATAKEKEKETREDFGKILFDEKLWTKKLSDLVHVEKKKEKDEKMEKRLRERLTEEGITIHEEKKGLQWLSSAKEGLRSSPDYFKLCEKDVGEIVIRGDDGKPENVSISLYNRGDDGAVTLSDFESDFSDWKRLLTEKVGNAGHERNAKGAVSIEGWMWTKGDSAYLLEASTSKRENRAEFMRLRVASISASENKRDRVVKRSSLEENVKKDDEGYTYINGVPMVDQGEKGYCVVASVERIGRYMGLEVDQHELAQVANTGNHGTTNDDMEKAFQRITGRIHVRTLKLIDYDDRDFERDVKTYNRAAKKAGVQTFDVDLDEYMVSPVMFWSQAHPETFREVKGGQNQCDFFQGKIKDYIDQGIPLAWTLFLGMFKEGDLPQSWGGHMRLITGYKFEQGEVPMILYTDSWGEGHARKTMRLDEAFCMTMGLYAMVPNQ